MTNKPIVTIITVTYNSVRLLQRTICSIEAQTYDSIEYIIVDGESDDGTLDIIKNNKHAITKWISEPDNGIYDAMNKGLKMANGDFVWFINAGDEIYAPDTLETMFSNTTQGDVYYGNTIVTDEHGNTVGLRRHQPPEELTWKSFRMGQLVSHQAFIPRLHLAPLYNLNYKHSADTDWQIKILKKAILVVNTNQILCKFLEGGKSKKTVIPSLKERFHIMTRNYGVWSTLYVHMLMIPRFITYYIRHRRFQ